MKQFITFFLIICVCFVTNSFADDFSKGSTNVVASVTSSLSRLKSTDIFGCKFSVKDNGDNFQISLLRDGKTQWKTNIRKKGTDKSSNTDYSFFEVTPIETEGYAALFLNADGLSAGLPFSYLIYYSLKSKNFKYYNYNESVELRDIDSNGQPEFLLKEYIDSECSNADTPIWYKIQYYSPTPTDDRFVYASKRYPCFYKDLVDEYKGKIASLSENPACANTYKQLVRKAEDIMSASSKGCESVSKESSSFPDSTLFNNETDFEIDLGKSLNGFIYSADGTLRYNNKKFTPEVKVDKTYLSKFKISIFKEKGLAAAIGLDSDGKVNRLFLLSTTKMTSREIETGNTARSVYWSPSGKYLVVLCSYEAESFISINLNTGKVLDKGILSPGGDKKIWRIKDLPRWKGSNDKLEFTVNETCNYYDDSRCDAEKILAVHTLNLDAATLNISKSKSGQNIVENVLRNLLQHKKK